MSGFVILGDLLRRGDYEVADKICPQCGTSYRGHVWTKPIAQTPNFRRLFVFQGRVLGWCDACITAEAARHRAMDEMMRRKREQRMIRRPRGRMLRPPVLVGDYPV